MNGEGLKRTQSTRNTDQDKMDIEHRDGGRQERGVWWYANGSLVLLFLRVGSCETRNDERGGSTAETGEETFRDSATRTDGPSDCASGVQEEWPFHS